MPVGADHAIKARLLPEHILNNEFAVAVAHIVSAGIHAPGDRIVGHDGCGFYRGAIQTEHALGERLQVGSSFTAGMDRKFAEGIVGIPSCLAGTAAGPVLCHGGNTSAAPAAVLRRIGLHSVTISPAHVRHQPGMGTKGIRNPQPPGFRTNIHLRRQRRGNAQSAIFPADDGRIFPAQFRIKGSCNTQTLGPCAGLTAAGLVLSTGRRRTVPGIRADIHRNTMGLCFRKGLHLIVPQGSSFCILQKHGKHMAQMVLLQEFLLLIGQRPCISAAFLKRFSVIGSHKRSTCKKGHHLMTAVHHQSGDLLNGQPTCQILCPLLRAEPPVLVGKQLPRARQVLKVQAVLFNQFCVGHAQFGAVEIGHIGDVHDAVSLSFFFYYTAYPQNFHI